MNCRLLTAAPLVRFSCRLVSRVIQTPCRTCSSSREDDIRNYIKESYVRIGKDAAPPPVIRGDVVYGTLPCMAAISGQKRRVHRVFVPSSLRSRDGRRELTYALQDILATVRNVHPTALHPLPEKYMYECLSQCGVHEYPDHEGIALELEPLHARPLISNRELLRIANRDTKTGAPPLVLACPFAQDMTNLGHLIRIAYYYGVHTVLVSSRFRQAQAINAIASSSSQGAVDLVDMVAVKGKLSISLEEWKRKFRIVGTVGMGYAGAVPLSEFKHDGRPVLLIMGSESKGIADPLVDICTDLVTIPACEVSNEATGSGVLESLNVSVAASILLHHITSSA
ncbi:rRNA methyltransferase 1, mitochondrial-like [Sycon ciliatum]|uniref:rRNA methyltransferase 1, mitochondrial-like n=1 Tax=Sycon ciliatum TaxID=27933 RepID=UPI0020A9F1E4|eukprot:scpid79408/ scgid10246/ rRNA methyltransferase 1, mitochondrial; Mitochondrial large ribosomal RNA ribose methylase